MIDPTLSEIRLIVHQQRRRVESLRQLLYQSTDLNAQSGLLQELAQAEQALHQLENQCQTLEPPQRSGVLLDTSDEGAISGGVMMGPETTGIDVRVLQRQSHVPTGIVHLLDVQEYPLVTYKISSTSDQIKRLRLISSVEGYSAEAIDTIELPEQGNKEIDHLPTFFPKSLSQVTELTRATLNIRVDDLDGKTEHHSTFPIWLLARTSAYNGIKDPATGKWIELWPYLAAWVTPFTDEVQQVLRRAADLHANRMIVGYQVDVQGVEGQVKAIFEALKAEEIRYVNSLLVFGAGQETRMQRVRLPRESIKTKSANCIDGTVLIASLLEAASLNPGLVIVPGHAFLAWETQAGSGQWDYLETTMIGSSDFAAAHLSGRTLAERYQALASQLKEPRYFQLFSLPDLRANRHIYPME
jgi:hypothetical protein